MTTVKAYATAMGNNSRSGAGDPLKVIDRKVFDLAVGVGEGSIAEGSARSQIAELAVGIPLYGQWQKLPNAEDIGQEVRLEMTRRIVLDPNSKFETTHLDLELIAIGASFCGWYVNLAPMVIAGIARRMRRRSALDAPLLLDMPASGEGLGALSTPAPSTGGGETFTLLAEDAAKTEQPRRRGGGALAINAALLARLLSLPNRSYGPASDTSPVSAAEVRERWATRHIRPLACRGWKAADVDFLLAQDNRVVEAVVAGATCHRRKASRSLAERKNFHRSLPAEFSSELVKEYLEWVGDTDYVGDFVAVLDQYADQAYRDPEQVKFELDRALDAYERANSLGAEPRNRKQPKKPPELTSEWVSSAGSDGSASILLEVVGSPTQVQEIETALADLIDRMKATQ